MAANIFVNLPVDDLEKSKKFFTKLGFLFNPQFTDEKAACLIVSPNIFVMLVTKKFFQSFTNKELCDATQSTEMILALSAESRDKVNEMIEKAVKAGGHTYRDPEDYGWMYGHGFEDLDGHQWEFTYMDPEKVEKVPG